ncbi:FAD-dependent oxidoreductase [Promicromonospora sp. NPDC023987]|uniref:NAD(P)/FAD-dependent oxidoreductase n=1 Tax=Promicromonospora sp. NPDC023987 TaxID=3155360 RepID=UPI0033F65CEE
MESRIPLPRVHHVDCVVVGAGVVGATITQQLARRGVGVALIDSAPGIGGGCSYANAAIVAPHHVTPLATPALLREAPVQMLRRPPAVRMQPDPSLVPWAGSLVASAAPRRAHLAGERLSRLAAESTRLHCLLADEGLSPTLRKTGAIDVYLRPPRRRRADLLSFERLQAIEPALAPVAAGAHDAEEWTLESRSFVKAMLDDARRHGADVFFGTAAERLLTEHGRVVGVAAEGMTLLADHVVLAAGLGSATLAAQVGLHLPLRGGRGYVIDVAAGDHAPAMPVRIKEHRVVVTPLADRVRVCGSIEFGDERRPMDPGRAEALKTVAARVLPGLERAAVVDRWAGERPCTPDGVPVIGRSRTVQNLSVATGHGMWGMILAPVTARMITDAVVDDVEPAEDAWLSPDRYDGRPARHHRTLRTA